MSSEISPDDRMLAQALASAGKSDTLRNAIFEALRKAEAEAADRPTFRDQIFAVRDFQGNYPMSGHPIEIIPQDHVYLEGPPHGFNVMATEDPGLVQRLGLRLVQGVSPKLLLHKDPALHHPIFSN